MAEVGLPDWFKEARPGPPTEGGRVKKARFVEKTGAAALKAFTLLLMPGAENGSRGKGPLARVTPKGRILGTFILLLAGAVAGSLVFTLCLTGLVFFVAVLCGVRPAQLATRVLPAFVLTLVLVIPVPFITGGAELAGFDLFGGRLSISGDGVMTALFVLSRVTAMVSAVMLLVLTTGESELFAGLRGLPVPGIFVAALYMTRRFLFVLLKTTQDAALARTSRTIDAPRVKDSQAWFASRAGLILTRSLKTSEDVTMAMVSRGFTGRLKTFAPGRLERGDLVWIGVAAFIFFLSLGRGA